MDLHFWLISKEQISHVRFFSSYQKLWPWQTEEKALTGYKHSCATARDSDVVSGNHCISSTPLSTEEEETYNNKYLRKDLDTKCFILHPCVTN